MTTQPALTSTLSDNQNLLIVLQELGAALRARSDPENILTAAAIGNFGAVAWGVAALKPQDYLSRSIWTRPATVAAVGVLFVAFCVVFKIWREHNQYTAIKEQYSRVAAQLKALPNGDVIPKDWPGPAGKGFGFSVSIVMAAAAAAVAFCLFVGW